MQTNWAGNLFYQAEKWHYPKSIEALQRVVTQCDSLNVVGSRHSFNAISDNVKNIVSLENLPSDLTIDHEKKCVTVSGNVRFGELASFLQQQGYALNNLASLPHISVAGACATGTHGSGNHNGNLATAVSAIQFVLANGDIVNFSRSKNSAIFDGVVVHLGTLGVVTNLTLDIVPTFQIQQTVYENLPLLTFIENWDAITSLGYSVSLFTNWQHQEFQQLWIKKLVNDNEPKHDEPILFGATRAKKNLHPLSELSAESCTSQLSKPGPWHERLPHFRMEFTPSHGEELQSEYFVPRHTAVAAIKAIFELSEQLNPYLLVSEIRTVAGDQLWLSPHYQRDSIAIHFTWKRDWENVQKLLPLIESSLDPFNARPHWGKLFSIQPKRLKAQYNRLDDFRALKSQTDPNRKFMNSFLSEYLDI